MKPSMNAATRRRGRTMRTNERKTFRARLSGSAAIRSVQDSRIFVGSGTAGGPTGGLFVLLFQAATAFFPIPAER